MPLIPLRHAWVTTSLVLLIAMGASAASKAPQTWPEQLQADYEQQFTDLAKQIDQFQNPLKVVVGKDKPDGGAALRAHLKRLEAQAQNREALILPTDRDPVDVLLRRTAALLSDIGPRAKGDLSDATRRLAELKAAAHKAPLVDAAARTTLFVEIARVRRQIALANPLLNFDKLLFLTHHRAQYEHMCDQYYGFHARPGGSLHVLSNPFSDEPKVRDLLAGATISNGRLRGKSLTGGSLMSLELSYDAKTILFAWTEGDRTVDKWTPTSTYHLFKVDADGKNLVQLTDGPFNDFDPCILPNGRIVFVSERCGGYLRCGGPRANPTYVLYSMDADGSNLSRLSFHETHEWHPSVDNDGMLVYTRWDYVDRDSDVAHHLWISYPDGRDPRSYHGNYPLVRESRPWMEMSIRAIPNSHRYVAVAAPHHGQAYGSMVLIDQKVEDDNAMSQLKRLTPDVAFPESEKWGRQVYGTPWPLSENYHLCVYDSAAKHYGIYLVDAFGNKELIWKDAQIAALDPIPFVPRAMPPVIPDQSRDINRTTGIVSISNVYDSDLPWPDGTKIKSLRVVEIFPKETIDADKPNIGLGRQALARGVLGTVPVESDGSAHFEMPANIPVYFQALDERGMAMQTMRSDAYVKNGERLACQGCHESKHKTPSLPAQTPLALRRAPSTLAPEAEGSYPLIYPRLVQPVLDRNCVQCHVEKKAVDLTGNPGRGKHGWTRSFEALAPLGWAKHGGNGSIKINGSERSIPGQVGAHGSKLLPLLEKDHYGTKLSPEDLRRITLWLDCNTNFYGAYHNTEKQARGEVVLPRLK